MFDLHSRSSGRNYLDQRILAERWREVVVRGAMTVHHRPAFNTTLTRSLESTIFVLLATIISHSLRLAQSTFDCCPSTDSLVHDRQLACQSFMDDQHLPGLVWLDAWSGNESASNLFMSQPGGIVGESYAKSNAKVGTELNLLVPFERIDFVVTWSVMIGLRIAR